MGPGGDPSPPRRRARAPRALGRVAGSELDMGGAAPRPALFAPAGARGLVLAVASRDAPPLASKSNGCERSAIHSRVASGGSRGCAASTPLLNDASPHQAG